MNQMSTRSLFDVFRTAGAVQSIVSTDFTTVIAQSRAL